MKTRLITLAFVTLLLSIIAVNANSNLGSMDGTTQVSGNFGIVNPCTPGELVFGPIDINIVVTTNRAPDGNFMVNVHHTSHGLLKGFLFPSTPGTPPTQTTGTEYQVSRVGKAQFNAVAPAGTGTGAGYTIPWRGEFIGKGAAPNFTATGELRVIVNSQNEPLGSNLVNVTTQCG